MCNNITTKSCSKCHETKSLSEYYRRGNGYAGFCKRCYVKKASEWASSNKDKRKEITSRWNENNKEKVAESNRKYQQSENGRLNNKLWRENNSVNYHRNKRQNDVLFALKFKMRSIINKSFYRDGYNKRSKNNEILGCSWLEFKKHLEKQFVSGMTWDNRSEWHIDHIVPLASAVTEDDVIRLNHFTNLRPLWAKDNLAKGGKVETLL